LPLHEIERWQEVDANGANMGAAIIEHCGAFAAPQVALSILTVGLWFGYLLAWLRREPGLAARPWRDTLEPLGALAMQIGLLGSIVGFIIAFGGFQDGLDVQRLTGGLARAYWTTGVGIVTALLAAFGVYTLQVLQNGEDGGACGPQKGEH
jgi:hypothetical protein